jgi:hypothetical protein
LEGEFTCRLISKLTWGDSMVAIMLGHLRMNVDKAIDALITVATAIFPEGSQGITDPGDNSRNLKDSIEDMLQARNIPVNTKMYERSRPQPRCKVYVYSLTPPLREIQLLLVYYTRQLRAISDTLKLSALTPFAVRVLIQPSSKLFAPRWLFLLTFYQPRSGGVTKASSVALWVQIIQLANY